MSKKVLVSLLALAWVSPAFSADVACPPSRDNHSLHNVSVFDGPPEEKADLVPDRTTGRGDHLTSTWEVAYLFSTKRLPHVVCRYSGLDDSKNVTIKLDKKVDRCVFRAHPKGQPAEMTCK